VTPRLPGLVETVTTMDEFEWTEVKLQRNADGSVSAIREKWPIVQPDFMSAYIEYDPGMITRRHGHFSHHLVWVIAGGAWFGDRWCPAGTHIELPFGAAFGPIIAGAAGTCFLEITNGDFRSWGDQPETFDKAVAAHAGQARLLGTERAARDILNRPLGPAVGGQPDMWRFEFA
jgi:hypothetical protein